MAYESLYRRFRPQRFSEVRGQDHVVTALHNAVRENRVGHAYLLSGPRGTGKTSTARILAKALNCTALDDGEPCGTCDSCTAIEAGTSYDLLELDAASNNGVEAMRDLIAKAALGSPGRTKVYLLDEVHMLSTGASNALLKTLEEPPGHVVFVLATTDPHKVLPTIRSRTQHFELHLLPADALGSLVDDVVAAAQLDLDDEAIAYALRTGDGSARDTLSALDQVVAAGGVLDQGDQVDELVDALADGDTGVALRSVADAVRRGHDPRVVGEALLAKVRDVFLHRMGDPLSQVTDDERSVVAAWATKFSDRSCTRALEEVGEALREMRIAPDARIPLEVALVRLTRADTGHSLDALVERIERLERGGGSTGAPAAAPAPASDAPGSDAPAPRPASSGSARPADAARAALSGRSTEPPATPRPRSDAPSSTAPSPAPAPTSDAPGPGGPPPVPRPPADAPPEPPTEAPAEAPADSRPDTPSGGNSAPAPAPAPAPGTAPRVEATTTPAAPEDTAPEPAATPASDEDLAAAWGSRVLPRLSGLTKAMFNVSQPSSGADGSLRLVVPNAVHQEKCRQKLPEVEAALADALGRSVRIQLVVEGTPDSARPTSATPADAAPPESSEDQARREADEIGPVEELEDAPADDRSATQRVMDAFPGAEVVEP